MTTTTRKFRVADMEQLAEAQLELGNLRVARSLREGAKVIRRQHAALVRARSALEKSHAKQSSAWVNPRGT